MERLLYSSVWSKKPLLRPSLQAHPPGHISPPCSSVHTRAREHVWPKQRQRSGSILSRCTVSWYTCQDLLLHGGAVLHHRQAALTWGVTLVTELLFQLLTYWCCSVVIQTSRDVDVCDTTVLSWPLNCSALCHCIPAFCHFTVICCLNDDTLFMPLWNSAAAAAAIELIVVERVRLRGSVGSWDCFSVDLMLQCFGGRHFETVLTHHVVRSNQLV